MTLPTTFDTISALLVTGPDPFGVPASHAFRWLSLLSYPVLGAMAWFGAGLLAEKTVGTQDASLTVHSLGPEQVYSFGLLILGGCFCLSHLGSMAGWLHYFALKKPGDSLFTIARADQYGIQYTIYDVISAAVPCVGGAFLAALSPQLGRKLARKKPAAARD